MVTTRLWRHVQRSLWFVPVVCVLAGSLLSLLSIAIDRAYDFELVPESLTGGPDAALAVLETVATSMVTLTALVLTITMVVVQLAMGQFSPRIVQTFLQDKPSQFAIGLFVATFAHSMLAMREVRLEEPVTVPGLAIVTAYVLVVVSIVVLVLYVHHIGQSLRVSALLEMVGQRTRNLIDAQYHDRGQVDHEPTIVYADRSGVINDTDDDSIVEAAVDHDCRIELAAGIGEFVPAGSPLFLLTRPVAADVADRLQGCAHLGMERTLDRDMAYGLRMLVDMAERAISESPVMDPTTTVQAIDRLHDCLRQLAPRPFPSGQHRDDHGIVRFVVPRQSWEDLVHLAFDELVLAGRRSPPVHRRLRSALDDLWKIAPPERRRVVELVIEDLERTEDQASSGYLSERTG